MNIYLSHSVNTDYINELYLPIKNSSINKNHKIFFPHDNNIASNTKEIIEKSDLILAEVSVSATGQGIELGWANSNEKPIICFYKDGTKHANSIKYIAKDIFSYSNSADLINKLENIL